MAINPNRRYQPGSAKKAGMMTDAVFEGLLGSESEKVDATGYERI